MEIKLDESLLNNGLKHAYALALKIISQPITIEAIEASCAKPYIHNVLRESINQKLTDGFNIYISNHTCTETVGFHTHQDFSKASMTDASNNIAIAESIYKYLPSSEKNTWTQQDRRYVLLTAWTIIHEASHCLATMLAEEGTILTNKTPIHSTAWGNTRRWGKEEMNEYGNLQLVGGERGYYVESILGGIMQCLVEKEDSPMTQLLLNVNEQMFEMNDEMITQMIFTDFSLPIRPTVISSVPAQDHRLKARSEMRNVTNMFKPMIRKPNIKE